MPNYVATYVVADREITVNTNSTQTLGAVAGTSSYLCIDKTDGERYILDLAQYMLHEPNLNFTLSLATIANSLTDFQIDAYTTTKIPLLDPENDGFPDRIAFYDAMAAVDITVAWTSIGNPTVRNDVYRRAINDDLVISSPKRDFSNSLVAVNGVFHKTYVYDNELYVHNGYKNIKNARDDKVAVLDTGPVGGHTVLPIGIFNIDASNMTPFNGVTLTFPGVDFTGKTVLMVIGGYLHILDGSYTLINTNRIQVNTAQIDLINNFLHNPNTIYDKEGLAQAVFEDRLTYVRDYPLTVYDKIMYYLWNQFPTARKDTPPPAIANFITFNPPFVPQPIPVLDEITYYFQNTYPSQRANTVTSVNVMNYSEITPHRRDAPTVNDSINKLLSIYNGLVPLAPVMLNDFEWSTKYEQLTSIVGTLDTAKFKDPVFVYNTLLAESSFFILLNTPVLYKRHYDFTRVDVSAQYTTPGSDTPRGVLFYNKQHTLPYVVVPDGQHRQNNASLRYEKQCVDAYKTIIDPAAIPSPLYDIKSDAIAYPVTMVESYTA